MTLLSLIIGKKNKTNDKAIILSAAFYLENLYFYQKSSMKELCNFISRQAISRSNKVGFTNLQHKGLYVVTLFKSIGITICAVLDNDKYPIRVMHRLLNSVLNDYLHDFPEIWKNSFTDYSIDWDKFHEKIVKYQDPREADKLYSIRCNLDETKEIMYQNIESILARGEKIDDLVQRSSDLSKTSKQFYKTTKKFNRCCVIS